MRLAGLQVVGAAALFSTGGAAIKGVSLEGFRGGMEIASLRSGVAAAAVAGLLPRARRGWTARTWMVGAAYAATVVLFVLANRATTAANAILLQSTAPLYLLVAALIALRARPRVADALVMVVLAAGLALFLGEPGDPLATAPRPELGNALAVASGATWAATLWGLRGAARGPAPQSAPLAAVLAGNLIAFAACLPFALPLGAGGRDLLLIAYLGVVQIGLAYLLLTGGLRGVPAFEASLLLLAEPALSPVWAWAFHDEVPGPAAIAAGCLIIGATVLKLAIDARRGAAAPGAAPP
ncbi:MAG: DMT family transporter [Thermoleophilia bacterium]